MRLMGTRPKLTEVEQFLFTLDSMGLQAEILRFSGLGVFIFMGDTCYVFDEHGKRIDARTVKTVN